MGAWYPPEKRRRKKKIYKNSKEEYTFLNIIENKIMESIDDRVDKLSSKPYTKTGRFSSESGQ